MSYAFDGNASYDGQSFGVKRRVWFTGTSALRKGQGLVYVADSGTATSVDGNRGYKVQLPTSGSYTLHFAGVAAQAYAANASGQSVEIWLPGSICDVAAIVDTTVNSGVLNCIVSSDTGIAGLFYNGGFCGRGAAIPYQTVTGNVTGSSVDGSAAVAGTTVTKTGLFTDAAAGDKVVILASLTSAAGAAGATQGVYTISSVTSANAAELTASAGTGDCAAVVYDPTGTVQARLVDSPSSVSGFVKWINPTANGAADAHLVNGYNHIFGGITLGTADSTATLADGVFIGQKVGFLLSGALTTNDYQLTVTTGLQQDGTTALAGLEFDAAADQSVLEWMGGHWALLYNSGPTKS